MEVTCPAAPLALGGLKHSAQALSGDQPGACDRCRGRGRERAKRIFILRAERALCVIAGDQQAQTLLTAEHRHDEWRMSALERMLACGNACCTQILRIACARRGYELRALEQHD